MKTLAHTTETHWDLLQKVFKTLSVMIFVVGVSSALLVFNPTITEDGNQQIIFAPLSVSASGDGDGDGDGSHSTITVTETRVSTPPSCYLVAAPVSYGQSANLSWTVSPGSTITTSFNCFAGTAGCVNTTIGNPNPTSCAFSPNGIMQGNPNCRVSGNGQTQALTANTTVVLVVSNTYGSRSCQITIPVGPPPINGVCKNTVRNGCTKGSAVALSSTSTHYRWTCSGQNGGSISPICSIPIPRKPVCNILNNSGTVIAGQPANINWTIGGGAATSCSFTPGSIMQGNPNCKVSGSGATTPLSTNTTVGITVRNAIGSSACSVLVPVRDPAPTCSNFRATPNPVNVRQTVNFSWDSSNQLSAKISCNGNVIATLSGSVKSYMFNAFYNAGNQNCALIITGINNQRTICNTLLKVNSVTVPKADLQILKTVSPTSQNINGTYTYTLSYRNNGPAPANVVNITDISNQLGSNGNVSGFTIIQQPSTGGSCSIVNNDIFTCSLGSLSSGQTGTIKYTATGIAVGNVYNKANITTTTPETNYLNNQDTAVVTITQPNVPKADVQIIKTVTPTTQDINGLFTYTLLYKNNGPITAVAVNIIDQSNQAGTSGDSNNFTIIQQPSSGGSCTSNANGLTCTLGNLANGQTGTIKYTATGIAVGSVYNKASIATATPERNYTNNQATAVVNIHTTPRPDLAIQINVDPSSSACSSNGNPQTRTYTIDWQNLGSTTMNNTNVNVSCLPTQALHNYQLVSRTINAVTTTSNLGIINGDTLTFYPFTANVGSNGRFIFKADVETGFCSATDIVCTASIASSTTPINQETDQNNNLDDATTNVVPNAELSIKKDVSIDNSNWQQSIIRDNGETAYYRVQVKNNGLVSATSNITDILGSPSNGGSLGAITNEHISPNVCTGSGNFTNGSGYSTCTLSANQTITITYRRLASNTTVPSNSDSSIINTATISNDGSGNSQNDTANVVITGPHNAATDLTITKSASTTSLGTGGIVNYTVTVKNNGTSNETFRIQDIMQGSQTGLAGGSNGGTMTLGSSNTSFDPVNSGTVTGSINNQPFQVTNLEPDATITITYQGTGSNSGVPNNQSSQFENIAEIIETGQKANKIVTIQGDTVTTSSSSSSSSSSGGGRRTSHEEAILTIKKNVWDGNAYIAADTFATAAEFNSCGLTTYQVVVENNGDLDAIDVEISDTWHSENATPGDFSKVNGDAIYNQAINRFLIDQIKIGARKTYNYQITVECGANVAMSAVNTAKIESAEPALKSTVLELRSVSGIGSSNPAYIIKKGEGTPDAKGVLTKKAAKYLIKPSEEDSYTIVFRNRFGKDLENVVFTDTFPFQYFDVLDANTNYRLESENGKIIFTAGDIKKNATKVITIKVRAKNVSEIVTTKNTVTIKASNHDLRHLIDHAEIIISPQAEPPVITRTGLPLLPLLIIIAGAAISIAGRRMLKV